MVSKMNILILCTGNSCRSQMAEGLFRSKLDSSAKVRSAGIEAHGLNQKAVTVMREINIDISAHTSDTVDKYLDDQFDYVITVCDNAAANCPVFPGQGKRLHWPFDDPAQASGTENQILDEFRRVRDEIANEIDIWLSEITSA